MKKNVIDTKLMLTLNKYCIIIIILKHNNKYATTTTAKNYLCNI